MGFMYYLQCEYREYTLPGLLEISFHTYNITGDSGRRTCLISPDDLKHDIKAIFQSEGAAYFVQWGFVNLVSIEFNLERAFIGIQENGKSGISHFHVSIDNVQRSVPLKNR